MSPGRPCRGTKTTTATGFRVEVPTSRGSTKRIRRTFRDEAAADRWRAGALAALEAGLAVPEPDSPLIGMLLAAPTASTPDPSHTAATAAPVPARTCDEVFDAYIAENYVGFGIADVERKKAVQAMYRNHIAPFLARHGFVTGTDVTRQAYVDWLLELASPPHAQHARHAGSEMLTTTEAVEVTGKSRSAIKSRISNGDFPGSVKTDSGRRLIPYADLVAAGLTSGPLRTGPRTPGGYCIEVIRDIRGVLDAVLSHGEQIAGWTIGFDREKVNNPHSRAHRRTRFQISMAQTVGIAARLHAVHAITLWLLRVCGLRASEAYGIHVGDVHDDGDHGLIRIYRQGGKDFDVLDADGNEQRVHSKEDLKTPGSVRVLIVPRQLMAAIRVVIDIFHTDPVTGIVDGDARLIPALREKNKGGQSAFRTALALAGAAEGVDLGDNPLNPLLPVPKDLRAGALTDLRWEQVPDAVRKRWGGHQAGQDVQSRHYLKDDPSFCHLLPATDALEKVIDEQCPDGLLVPSLTRCTTGAQPLLASDATRIDTALIAAGWLTLPSGQNDAALCDTAQAASLLQRGHSTARVWMRDHPEAVHVNGQRHIPLDVVLAECARIRGLRTLSDLATEWGCLYHKLYYWVTHHALDTETLDHNVHVPPATETRLKSLLEAERALQARAMPITDAAEYLGLTVAVVHTLIAGGHLVLDDERGPKNTRYITGASIEAFRAAHRDRCA